MTGVRLHMRQMRQMWMHVGALPKLRFQTRAYRMRPRPERRA
jgi:hypothetical protein